MRHKRYNWLSSVINKRKFRTGAEIGAATGIMTQHLLDNCPTLEKLVIVDDWRPIPESEQWKGSDMEKVFRQKFNGETRLRILKGLSWEMAQVVDGFSLDFVFIDASHDYDSVMKDLEAWENKVRPGGILCGHDLHFDGVMKALFNKYRSFYTTGVDNTWYIDR